MNRLWLTLVIAALALSAPAAKAERKKGRPRLIIETDAGGDPDDKQSLVRELPKKDAEKRAIALNANKLSGTRGSIVELNVKQRPKLPSGERPYEHPFFWAAFTLVGDPD